MDTADKHKRMRWTGAVKGREVFESKDSLMLSSYWNELFIELLHRIKTI